MRIEESFSIYLFWTFILSFLNSTVYIAIYWPAYRKVFLAMLFLAIIILVLYSFRDKGLQYGWDAVGEAFLIILIVVIMGSITMLISAILAIRAIDGSPITKSFIGYLEAAYRFSPLLTAVVNLANIYQFFLRL